MILHRNRLAAVLMLFLPTLFYLSLNQWWLNNHTSTNVDVKQALVSLLTEETVMVREEEKDCCSVKEHGEDDKNSDQQQPAAKDETRKQNTNRPPETISKRVCPPPAHSIRLALVGNDFVQQLPVVDYGGIEAAVENLALGIKKYMTMPKDGEWCSKGWVEISDFVAVVPKRDPATIPKDKFNFTIIDTPSPPKSRNWIGEVRKILEVEQPDVIWSQSKWSAEGLKQLNIPIVCSIHDSGARQSIRGFGKDDPNMVYYRFMSQAQRNIWVRTNEEKRGSSFLWEGFDEAEFALGNPKDRKHYLYVSGNWGRGKGIDMVLALAERNPNDTFLACGSKDLEEELTKFASTHPNFKYELVLPRGTKHKEAFMNAKGLLMFTQLDESFGRVTVEALAKGTPVFGSTKGANPELVKVPEMGFLSNDVEEVNKHLHDAFNYTHIHLEAKRLFHIQQEVKRMLNITLHMLEKKY